MFNPSFLRDIYDDVSYRGPVYGGDFQSALLAAGGANRYINLPDFTRLAQEYLGVGPEEARTAFHSMAGGRLSVRANDAFSYLGLFNRDGVGPVRSPALDALAAWPANPWAGGPALLVAPLFGFAPRPGSLVMDYDDFKGLLSLANLADDELGRAVYDDVVGGCDGLGADAWTDAFGRSRLGRDAFRDAVLGRAESLGFLVFSRAATDGLLGYPDFERLSRGAGLADWRQARTVFDYAASGHPLLTADAWRAAFGSDHPSRRAFAGAYERILEQQGRFEFQAAAGMDDRLGFAEFSALARRAGLQDMGTVRTVFDRAAGGSPWLSAETWRTAFGGMRVDRQGFTQAFDRLLNACPPPAAERIDFRDHQAPAGGWRFGDFRAALGARTGYTGPELRSIFDTVAGADRRASPREMRTAFGALSLDSDTLTERLDSLFERLDRCA